MCSRVPALDLVAAGVGAQVARDQVLDAQDLRAALAHELAALAQQVAHGTLARAGRCSPWAGCPGAAGEPGGVRR